MSPSSLFPAATETVAALVRDLPPLDPDNPWGQGQDVITGAWSDRLADGLDGFGAAWAEDRPAFDRALGLAGRDPDWSHD